MRQQVRMQAQHLSSCLGKGIDNRQAVQPARGAEVAGAEGLDAVAGTHGGLHGCQLASDARPDDVLRTGGQWHAGGRVCQHIQLQ